MLYENLPPPFPEKEDAALLISILLLYASAIVKYAMPLLIAISLYVVTSPTSILPLPNGILIWFVLENVSPTFNLFSGSSSCVKESSSVCLSIASVSRLSLAAAVIESIAGKLSCPQCAYTITLSVALFLLFLKK